VFEIRELRHLLSIDEFRHFGRAAKAVGLSQPALTKSLQRMELALGAKLFERSRARVAPTAIGVEVLTRARRLVDQAADLKRTVGLMNGAAIGSATIGVGPAMAETYIASAIAIVAQQHPRTQIKVRVDHWQQLTKWLLAGELDFYVADVGEARVGGHLHYTSLPPQEFVWFCRRSHPLATRKKKTVTRRDLLGFPIATPKMPAWATEWFAAGLGDEGVAGLPSPFPTIECESYAMLKRLVATSDCLSAALEQTIARELEYGSLVVLRVNAPEPTTHAGIVRPSDRSLSPLAAELVACVEVLANSKSSSN
jgi:DNA-binding transcriptional LysR family regulator